MTYPLDLDRHRPCVLELVEKASGSVRLRSETLGLLNPVARTQNRAPVAFETAKVTLIAMAARKFGDEEQTAGIDHYAGR